MTRRQLLGKRVVDVTVGTLLALAVLPAIVALAVLSAVVLRTTKPFFVHRRVGRHGRLVPIVKIRTLPLSTDRYAAKHALADVAVPRPMKALRRLHLDELPQLLLVPLGLLSLVGPRPEMPFLHEAMDEDFRRARTSVRPGCTGLWQVGDRSVGMIHEAPEFDLVYLRHASLRLDLWIVWRTCRIILGHSRPLTVEDLRMLADEEDNLMPGLTTSLLAS
jgi:lipopolysaccharide/colanic/teichoic acid biosynthesis glycosyltransferase